MKRRTFRMFSWQKIVPLIPLPVFAFMLWVTPVAQGWSLQVWVVLGGVAGLGVAYYLAKVWSRALVILDEEGMSLHLHGGHQQWPHTKLLKVKEIGRFRARMCYDPDIVNKHMHISFDLFNRDGFVDALLDFYEEATGHELPELDEAA